jgi:cysteinyl-tRNA synthetase
VPALAAAVQCRANFLAAMDDDFNTGGAIGELFELARVVNKFCDDQQLESGAAPAEAVARFRRLVAFVRELSRILGLFLVAPQTDADERAALLSKVMQLVVELRAEARSAKNFAVADAIRNGLAPLGLSLEDRAGGTEWTGGGPAALAGVMELLLELRQAARARKDFAFADAVRDRLATAGIVLEDRAGGAEWSVKS